MDKSLNPSIRKCLESSSPPPTDRQEIGASQQTANKYECGLEEWRRSHASQRKQEIDSARLHYITSLSRPREDRRHPESMTKPPLIDTHTHHDTFHTAIIR